MSNFVPASFSATGCTNTTLEVRIYFDVPALTSKDSDLQARKLLLDFLVTPGNEPFTGENLYFLSLKNSGGYFQPTTDSAALKVQVKDRLLQPVHVFVSTFKGRETRHNYSLPRPRFLDTVIKNHSPRYEIIFKEEVQNA